MIPSFYAIKGRSSEVVAKSGVVAARNPLTASAGVGILKSGGNAVDAAVTSALVACVVEPYFSGIGGGGDAVIYLSGSKESACVDFWGITPRRMTPDHYEVESRNKIGDPFLSWAAVKEDANLLGHKSVVVPGMVAGLSEILEKYGTITFTEALQPAIRVAAEGVIVNSQLSAIMGFVQSILIRYPEAAKIFLKDGAPFMPWPLRFYEPERLVQKDLARTLERLAKHGPDDFYRGETAERISRDMEKHDGLIDEAELKGFGPHWERPTPGDYRGCDILYLPGGGGTVMMEILNILENFSLRRDSPVGASTLHLLIRAIRMGFHDMLEHMGGEPGPSLLSKLTSKDYAADLSNRLETWKPGRRWLGSSPLENTSCLTAVDRERNIISLTLSQGLIFGSGVVVPHTGVLLNDLMICSDPIPGRSLSVNPGKRQFFPTTPVVVLKDGKPFLAAAGLGGCRIITAVTRVVSNVIDYGMNVLEAQESPRVTQAGRDLGPTLLDSRIPEETALKLKGMGDEVVRVDTEFGFALTSALTVDSKTGRVNGAAERALPYGMDGSAFGY